MNKRIYKKHMKWYYQALVWRMCTASPSKIMFDNFYEKVLKNLSKEERNEDATYTYKIFKKLQLIIISKPRFLRHFNFYNLVSWGIIAHGLDLSVYPQVIESCYKAGGMR